MPPPVRPTQVEEQCGAAGGGAACCTGDCPALLDCPTAGALACGGNGLCNQLTGACACHAGHAGDACAGCAGDWTLNYGGGEERCLPPQVR